jgi:peroxiredoxin
MKTTLLTLALIGLMAIPVFGQYQVGDPVPDFTLRNQDGNNVSMSDYPNRIIFMTFWYTG